MISFYIVQGFLKHSNISPPWSLGHLVHSVNHLSSLGSTQPVQQICATITKLVSITRTLSAICPPIFPCVERSKNSLKCLARGHKCPDQDSNPHSAEHSAEQAVPIISILIPRDDKSHRAIFLTAYLACLSQAATVPRSPFWWSIGLRVNAASPKMRTSLNNAQFES